MAELKTKITTQSAEDFLHTVQSEEKQRDSLELLSIFEKVTGQKAKMWGTAIVGFGQYHYKSERSSQEGDWPLTAFSPRKQNLTLYLMGQFNENKDLLAKLGKHKTSVGCLYINKLADVDIAILTKLIEKAYLYMKRMHD